MATDTKIYLRIVHVLVTVIVVLAAPVQSDEVESEDDRGNEEEQTPAQTEPVRILAAQYYILEFLFW
jgi:hypothetical protein